MQEKDSTLIPQARGRGRGRPSGRGRGIPRGTPRGTPGGSGRGTLGVPFQLLQFQSTQPRPIYKSIYKSIEAAEAQPLVPALTPSYNPVEAAEAQPLVPALAPSYSPFEAAEAHPLDPALTPSYDPAWYSSTQQHGELEHEAGSSSRSAGQLPTVGQPGDWHRRYSSATASSQTESNSPPDSNTQSFVDPLPESRVYQNDTSLSTAVRTEPVVQDRPGRPSLSRSPSPSSPILSKRNQKRGPYYVETGRRDSE